MLFEIKINNNLLKTTIQCLRFEHWHLENNVANVIQRKTYYAHRNKYDTYNS